MSDHVSWWRRALRWLVRLAVVVAGALAIWLARRHIKRLLARLGLVTFPAPWRPHPTDPTVIVVEDDDATEIEAKLPQGVTSDQVRAAGLDRGGVTVEVLHTPTDRRPGRPVDDSAAGSIGSARDSG